MDIIQKHGLQLAALLTEKAVARVLYWLLFSESACHQEALPAILLHALFQITNKNIPSYFIYVCFYRSLSLAQCSSSACSGELKPKSVLSVLLSGPLPPQRRKTKENENHGDIPTTLT